MSETIRFGLLADVHQDFMYRADDRLKQFIEDMNRERVDFIVQLGDFCYPLENNRYFVNTWNQFQGPRYHVLGNHDMDGCNKQTVMDFWGMENNYYSFDSGDYHFVVLDGNHLYLNGRYEDYAFGNYHSKPDAVNNLTPQQLEWLEQDLRKTDRHTIIFSHQNLESPYNDDNVGVHNSEQLQAILRTANEQAGFRKVIACMNGHNHVDGVKVIDDIYFIQINSMSFFYMGKDYHEVRYSEEVTEKYPILGQSAPYKDALYAIVTLEQGQLTITGRDSEFVGPDPLACGHRNTYGGHVVSARIASRKLKY